MKNFFILVLIALVIVISIFKSKEVYKFHIRFYYLIIKKSDYKTLIVDVRKKFKEIKKDDKDSYHKLRDHIEELLLIYPEDQELSQYLGLIYIRLGYKKKGAQVIVMSRIEKNMPTLVVDECVTALFEDAEYSDIVYFIDNIKYTPNQTILYHYGISLFMTRDYKKAIEILSKSNIKGMRSYKVNYYLGLSHYNLKQYDKALGYLKKAYDLNYSDRGVSRALIETYRMLDRFKDAERILRRTRR